MIILEDSRQQMNKHELKHEYWQFAGIEWKRTKLYVGDYTLPRNQSVCIDTKYGIQELIGNVCSSGRKDYLDDTDDVSEADGFDKEGRPYKRIGGHERFRAECIRAQEAGIKLIVLLETDEISNWHDLIYWHNPRKKNHPRATNGVQLFKALVTMQQRYGVQFRLCRKEDAGRAILTLLGIEDHTDQKKWKSHLEYYYEWKKFADFWKEEHEGRICHTREDAEDDGAVVG